MLLAVHLFVTAMFAVMGLVLQSGRGAWLISGYNTSSAAKKAEYDEKKLCRGMAKLMFVLSGCWFVAALSEVFNNMALLWTGMGLFLAAVIVGLIYMNTGNRFKKQ